jgi:hypothetical protein
MKKFSKIIISAVMITALSVTMLFTVAEMGIMVGNEPVVLTALGSGGDTPYVPPASSKKANPITVSGKTVKISYNKLKKKNQTISRKKAIDVSNAQGRVSYRKKSGNSKITVTSSGNFNLKKGLKAGTYTVKVNVTASGNSRYYSRTKVATVKIKVLTVENPVEVEGKAVKIKGDDLAAGNKVLPRKKVISVSKAQGKVTYKKASGDKNITVNKKTGDITVKSALAGDAEKTYTVKVKVIAAGNNNYKKGSETAAVKITITPVTPPDPVDPADPVNPDDPVDPVDPVNPDNPSDQVNPDEPTA